MTLQPATIDPVRLASVTTLTKNAHNPNSGKMCAMEAVAYIVGEPWSDAPRCVCPTITAFMRRWNDALSQMERDLLLLPLISTIINTSRGQNLAEGRKSMVLDWTYRTNEMSSPGKIAAFTVVDKLTKEYTFPSITPQTTASDLVRLMCSLTDADLEVMA